MARQFLSLFCPAIPADQLIPIVEWCERYSPLVAADGSDGIILEITGCTHLFGGEGPLLLDLQQRLYRMGIKAHVAISDSWGAAWAWAQYGKRSIVYEKRASRTGASLDSANVDVNSTG